MALNLEAPLTGLTWGELRKFVALGSHMADEDEVYASSSDYDGSYEALVLIGIDLEDRPCP
jgi:hypothetical protein